jgi:hypothetical protein
MIGFVDEYIWAKRKMRRLYHCKTWSFEWSMREKYFDFRKSFVSIVRICCF